MSVRPLWKQGLCGNQTTSIGLSSTLQVTSSLVNPTTDHRSCGTTPHRSAFSAEEGSPGARVRVIIRVWVWHSQSQAAVPCPDPGADRFAQRVSLVVCDPAPTIPNSAVRCCGIPPRSPRGGCQRSIDIGVIDVLCLDIINTNSVRLPEKT